MNKPTNALELIAYLRAHPYVYCHHPRPERAGLRRYETHAMGGLHFRNLAGEDNSYVPIDCGRTPHETGLTFDEGGFTVEKFGVAFRFDYRDGPE